MKIFYHSADLDGHCSGAIVKARYPKATLHPINYGQAFPWDSIQKDEEVFLVDFSLQPFEDMERLNSLAKLHWIDHHVTALKEAEQRNFLASGGALLEVGRAGCELTWLYLYGTKKALPLTVYLLGRYDVFDLEASEDVLPFQYGIRQYDTDPEHQEFWQPLLAARSASHRIGSLLVQGRTLLQYIQQENAKKARALAFETFLRAPGLPPLRVIAINQGLTNSLIFDTVYNPSEHDAMATFCYRKDKWTVSLFTKSPDLDVSLYAKALGGGGHRQAAGFQVPSLEDIFSQFTPGSSPEPLSFEKPRKDTSCLPTASAS